MDKIFKITVSVGCAIIHKIPNIQISTIENTVKLIVLLNADTTGTLQCYLSYARLFRRKD
jgi:nitrate reductase NapAB chaperone NapD